MLPKGNPFQQNNPLHRVDFSQGKGLPVRSGKPLLGVNPVTQKTEDVSIFHGKSELTKKYAIKEIKGVAKEIGKLGYREREKYGIKGNKSWDYKHFAEDIVKSLPNTTSPSIIDSREIKKGLKLQKRSLGLHQSDNVFNPEEVKKDKQRLRFLKRISGLK